MKIIKVDHDGIEFDNGTKITDHHEQECCESVYADWQQIDEDSKSHEFNPKIELEGVEDAGFRIEGYFIPCYNSQNGYYSSDLAIIVEYPDKTKVETDISRFVKDQID